MRLDHISYACNRAELADVVQRIGSDLGATFRDGGRHPRFGTCNFILPLQNGQYIEVVTALDHPAAEKANFGRAVSQRASDGGGWFSWVIGVDDITPIEERLGRPAKAGHRIRPDGHELAWKQLGIQDVMKDPQLPFFVEWLSAPEEHPSVGAGAVSIERIEIAGARDTIAEWLGEAGEQFLDDVEVTWIDADDPGIQAVWFNAGGRSVRID